MSLTKNGMLLFSLRRPVGVASRADSKAGKARSRSNRLEKQGDADLWMGSNLLNIKVNMRHYVKKVYLKFIETRT